MKKMILAGAFLLGLVACQSGGHPEKAEDVATAFLDALEKNDIERAKALGTKKTAEALDLGQKVLSETDDVGLREVFRGSWSNVTCEGDDLYKTCTVCCTHSGMNAPLVLMREQGLWKVNLDKAGSEAVMESLQMLGGIFEDIDTTGLDAELDRVIDSLERAQGGQPEAK